MLRIALGVSVAVLLAPTAAADPGSAKAVIDELENQGYDVAINWVSGVSSRPLSECRSLGVHNPDLTGPPPTTFTTVYVDVSCPNDHDDGGVRIDGGLGGVGIGVGS
ncbi:hypothetical protein FK535_00500 [Mycolicibacterium sp. 018/SC-01/001]|uniref:hypothetical protein n=1 Tax=Mycolicibacterium sp. 018/SC-01/001 TaxID=2592069 RepID=UPI0011816975|nr:hypothetical protein [Mycolicibacterium sp. 018/SC-01/001]TRW88802.1 hypothetical protein FK535_00500 [Mycolicibacterium sp. 018/SC-01/001]